MFKRLLCGVVLCWVVVGYAVAGGRMMLTLIGPSASTGRVTIAAAGANIRNCLTDIDVVSDASYTFRILDGATTAYAVTLTSGATIVRSWSQATPFCGATNTLMELVVSNGNLNINYSGFTGQ